MLRLILSGKKRLAWSSFSSSRAQQHKILISTIQYKHCISYVKNPSPKSANKICTTANASLDYSSFLFLPPWQRQLPVTVIQFYFHFFGLIYFWAHLIILKVRAVNVCRRLKPSAIPRLSVSVPASLLRLADRLLPAFTSHMKFRTPNLTYRICRISDLFLIHVYNQKFLVFFALSHV